MKPLVLIADDEPLIISTLARLVTRAGLSYIGESCSARVQEIAREFQPHLVLLDICQPVNGRDVLAGLKRDPLTRHITVVMLSAFDDPTTRALCSAWGATEFQKKPFPGSFIDRVVLLAQNAANSAAGPRRREPSDAGSLAAAALARRQVG